uniref:DsbC domain-containing protein n=1 Tax=Bursaphelenchus xylophilus TaxID=6326 RepID=A0A1I7SNH2_BURXY
MVDVDFPVKDQHHQPVIISIVSTNMEELEWCFRPGPSRSLMINGKQYSFDIPEVGIHQTCHAMRTPGGNGVVNDMFHDATALSSNRCLGSEPETPVSLSLKAT